jgi:hypothetical protein
MPPAVATRSIGLGPAGEGGGGGGDILEAMARIAPPQPNEAMARIAPRLAPQPNNGKQQNFAGPQPDSFGVDSRIQTTRSSSAFNFCVLAVPGAWDRATTQSPLDSTILRSAQERFPLNPPYSVASFVVNSEPHTGVRSSIRLCVRLIIKRRRRRPR